jgi:RNA polymerase sigma factor (sigma-70 family)
VVGKNLVEEAHESDPPGTNPVVRLSTFSTMSQSRTEFDRGPPNRSPSTVRVGHAASPFTDGAADAGLADRVFALVYRQMHSLWGKHRGDFDDLVQVASEQAVRALPSFRRESELSTWTYRICYHTVRKHQRWSARWLRRFTLDAPYADAPARAATATDVFEEHERAERLHRALDRLSAKRRAVVVMRDLEGLAIPQISAIVGANEATVRSRLRDARKDLGRLLENDPYFGEDACEAGAT